MTAATNQGRYVVHWHSARRVHFDLRLELDGVAKSFAVPKGPPLTSGVRRLAVATDDHPLEFLDFDGEIEPGRYGAGPLRIWDRGRFELDKRTQGELKLRFSGSKLSGSYVLVATGKGSDWLFLKHAPEDGSSGAVGGGTPEEGPRRLGAFSPMLCAPQTREPFDDERYFFEIKWDGVRVTCALADGEVSARSRTGQDVLASFPELLQLARNLCAAEAVVDGEVVVLDEQGVSDFQRLQPRLQTTPGSDAEPIVYYVFDLLFCDGEDLTPLAWTERRSKLGELLQADGRVRLSDAVQSSGTALFEHALARGAEGLVAKRGDSRYLPGQRSEAWLKLTRATRDSFYVGGYTRGRGTRSETLGALLLGAGDREPLSYVGRVGSGLTDAGLADAKRRLSGLERPSAPFDPVPSLPRPVTWVEPRLRCEVEYANKTRSGRLRAPRFRRWVSGPAVSVSNPDKLFWPESNITKADLVAYYTDIAEAILPHLAGRPMVMNRFPDGYQGESFYQKHAPEHRPAWLETVTVQSESAQRAIDYVLCGDEAHLRWLANAGCIEMNPWLSRLPDLDAPTQVLFDLDPNPPTDFSHAAEVALALHSVLDRIGLEGFAKSSGGRGIHVMVGIQEGLSFEFVRLFAELVARVLVRQNPELVTVEQAKQKRGARVGVDYRQNRRGSTIASVYSVRPRAGAPVSCPLDWEELEAGLDPGQFSLDSVRERVRTRGDLFYPVLAKRQGVTDAVEALQGLVA